MPSLAGANLLAAGAFQSAGGAATRMGRSLARAIPNLRPGLEVTITVGAGSDRSAENYARFFSRPQGGGVGDSAADARAAANYLSFFSRLQGGGVGDSAADARAVANYLSFFTLPTIYTEIWRVLPGLTLPGYGINPGRSTPPPATGLRL